MVHEYIDLRKSTKHDERTAIIFVNASRVIAAKDNNNNAHFKAMHIVILDRGRRVEYIVFVCRAGVLV